MLSLNGSVSTVILMVMLAWPQIIFAQVLELGASSVHGKKDQPEAMTFVSRAPLQISETRREWKPVSKIKQEVSRAEFEVFRK